ncbi:MAG: hypothetical protein J0H98_09665 [Solirubrobacterales bacterium]|nr:hypothetical protein [Solirubrobacterales bacterium]
MSRKSVAERIVRLSLIAAVLALPALLGPNAAQAGCGGPAVKSRTLAGTACSEVLVAPKGVTTIKAGGGNDVIIGSPDVRVIVGGNGNDVIYGEKAPAAVMRRPAVARAALRARRSVTLFAACDDPDPPENQHCLGGGDDDVSYGKGDQIVYGQGGNDFIWGGRGNDELIGGDGNDRLFGSVGDDYLEGDAGDDRLAGSNGSDNIFGNAGDDYIHGDTIGDVRDYTKYAGGPGLHGGPGHDTLSFATAVTPGFDTTRSPISGSPLTTDFNGVPSDHGVYVDLTDQSADNGKNVDGGGKDEIAMEAVPSGTDPETKDRFEVIVGSAFTDVIVGDSQANTIWGGGGADILIGNGGNDTLTGGQDGDYLDGGTGSADEVYGGGPTATTGHDHDQCVNYDTKGGCENLATTPRTIEPPDPSLVNVGLMSSPNSNPMGTGISVYLTGTSGNEDVDVKYYAAGNGGRGSIQFTRNSGPIFNLDAANANGCDAPGGGTITCPLSGPSTNSYDLTPTILVSGQGGDDTIDSSTNSAGSSSTNFPKSTTKVVLGRDGADIIKGDNTTQDVLIDGAGNDHLYGMGDTDSVYATDGKDSIYGGPGEDVLYSTRTCEDNTLDGGTEEDNITWAAWNPTGSNRLPNWTETPGVFASLKSGKVGTNVDATSPTSATPTCSSGTVDTLTDIENLEGTGGRDTLVGDSTSNTLLGRAGPDRLYGEGSSDYLRTHSNDYDALIDCGTHGSEADKLARDYQRGDNRDDGSALDNCGDATLIKGQSAQPYGGLPPEYDRSVDMVTMDDPSLLGLYRLGERSGNTAFEAFALPTESDFDWDLAGTYSGEGDSGDARYAASAIPDTDDRSHSLDGVNDYVRLTSSAANTTTTPNTYYDPYTYRTNGYTAELWAKVPSSSSTVTGPQYLLHKKSSTNGVSIYLQYFSGLPIVVATVDRGSNPQVFMSAWAPSMDVWHHYAVTLDPSTNSARFFIDGTQANQLLNQSVSIFPQAGSGTDALVGWGGSGTNYTKMDVDNLAFYKKALSSCVIGNHADLNTSTYWPATC